MFNIHSEVKIYNLSIYISDFYLDSQKLFVVNKYFSYNFYVFSFCNLGIAHCRKSCKNKNILNIENLMPLR